MRLVRRSGAQGRCSEEEPAMAMIARHGFGADLVKVGAPAVANNLSQPTMARKTKDRLHDATAFRVDHCGMMRIEEAVQAIAMETRRLIDLPVYPNFSWVGYPGSQSGSDEREARMGSQTRPKRALSQAGVTSAAHQSSALSTLGRTGAGRCRSGAACRSWDPRCRCCPSSDHRCADRSGRRRHDRRGSRPLR